MKNTFNYRNDNFKIFPGFYESVLWDSDRVYYENKEREEEGSPNVDVVDFDGYKNAIGEKVTSLITDLFDEEICDKCIFIGIDSPKYYNYETDKICIKLNIDLERLKEWVLGNADAKDGFDEYLATKYSTRSGFISYTSNNIDDYFAYDFKSNLENRGDILIDYYLLTKIYQGFNLIDLMATNELTLYEYNLDEIATETFYEYLEEVAD